MTPERLRPEAEAVSIAPGRVNLIGEHTDYNGLPVLPMALDRDVRVPFRALREPVVRLADERAEFGDFAFGLGRPVRPAAPGHWSNYVRAAAKGLLDHGVALRRGIEGRVSGNVPPAAGLASSSALVVASAQALLHANGRAMPPLELAALAARAERFAGAEGGGMDQAASLCGVAGHALHIGFGPLRVAPVPAPGQWRWLLASSLAAAEKTGRAREAYNERVRECRDAARRLAADRRSSGHGRAALEGEPVAEEPSLGRLVAAFGTDVLLDLAKDRLDPVLLRRARHVLTEARRVEQALGALRASRPAAFGELMTASHESLRDDYEVSTHALDALVSIALEAGAAGARLTGAGFGGFAVVLCADATASAVEQALGERFYAPRLGRAPTDDELFFARPSRGARVQSLRPPA